MIRLRARPKRSENVARSWKGITATRRNVNVRKKNQEGATRASVVGDIPTFSTELSTAVSGASTKSPCGLWITSGTHMVIPRVKSGVLFLRTLPVMHSALVLFEKPNIFWSAKCPKQWHNCESPEETEREWKQVSTRKSPRATE